MADIKQIIGSKYESINAHMFSIEALCKGYDTDIGKGLTAEQAKENLKKYGPNKMKNMPECTMVKRDGEFQRIMTEDLVPGDITLLEGGSGNFGFIAGDIRIVNIIEPVYVESYFLYNNHLNYIKEMTAEQTSEDPLETNNLIFYGTSVFAGRCLGLVFQTGENMLLSDVCPDKLATPELPDSEDEEKGLLSSIASGLKGIFGSKSEEEGPGPLDFGFHNDTIENICEMFSTDIEKGLTTEQAKINRAKSGKNKYNHYEKIMNYTKCKRDGELQNIMSRRLTIGDIIILKAPQVVPADLRIIEVSADCTVNKSGLSGESELKKVSTEKTHENPLETQNVVFALTKITTGTCTGIVVNVGKDTIMGKLSGLTSTLG